MKHTTPRAPRTSDSLNPQTAAAAVDAVAAADVAAAIAADLVTLSGDARVLMCGKALDGGRVELYMLRANGYALVLNGRVVERLGGTDSRNAGAAVAAFRALTAKSDLVLQHGKADSPRP